MSRAEQFRPAAFVPLSPELEGVVEAFERAWRRGERPALDAYLRTAGAGGRDVLVELIHADLECRLKAGEAVRVEDYLARYPELADDAAVVAGLIATEFLQRRRRETGLTLSDFQKRFPRFGPDLVQGLLALPDESLPVNGSQSVTTRRDAPGPVVEPGDRPEVAGYEIVGELGRGGMGVVYQARQVLLDRPVALKMIRWGPLTGSEERARFHAEAEVVARLQHPHIVQIHEVGEADGRPFFSLEFVAGGSLADRLDGTPLPARPAAGLVELVARAIHWAHRQGVVHRDLKPANILLAPSDRPDAVSLGGDPAAAPRFEPKVSDFGLAKRLDRAGGQTQTGAVLGTPSYMAPEQAEGKKDVGPAADVYALGAILYELLTGRPPFNAETPLDTLQQVLTRDPVPPSRLQAKVPRDLETICLKCLEKAPGKRFPSAEELAEDLRRFLDGEPIRARPVGRGEQLVKWARRRPAAAAVTGVSALAAAALVVVGVFWYLQKLETDAARIQAAEQKARVAKNELREQKRQGEQMGEGRQSHLAGERAFRDRDLAGAGQYLEKCLASLAGGQGRPVAELREQAAHLLARTRQWLEVYRLRDEALLSGTNVGTQERDDILRRIRAAARKALEVIGASPDGEAPPSNGRSAAAAWEEGERGAVSFELLLVLAQAVAEPLAGESAADQAGRALRLLDRAARVHPDPSRAYHLRRARYLARRGDEAGAERERRQAARVASVTAGAQEHFLLGDECYQAGDLALASRHFKEALQRDPRHFWARFLLAVCHVRQHRYAEGAATLSACVQARPDFVWPYLLRGFAEGELGAAAAADLRLTPAQRRENADAHYRAAEEDFRKAARLPKSADTDYVLLVNRGLLRYRQKRYDEAAQDLERARRMRPDRMESYLNLANVWKARGDMARGLRVLTAAIGERKLKAPALYRVRAKLSLALKPPDRQAALDDLQRAIDAEPPGSRSPEVVDDHRERALLLARRRRYPDALAEFDRALKISPDDAVTLRLHAETLIKLGRFAEALPSLDRYLDRAAGALDEYTRRKEPVGDVYRRRGQVHGKLGRVADALADYTRALAIDPNAGSYAFRGWLYVASGAPRLALPDFEKALALDPKNAGALTGRGYARVLLNQHRAGVADAEEALRRGPCDAQLVYKAARVYAQASAMVVIDEGPRSRAAQVVSADYQDRALELLRQALDLCRSPADRAELTPQILETDPALKPIRTTPRFARLVREFARRTAR